MLGLGNELPSGQFVERVRAAGFDGIEMSLPLDDETLKKRQLAYPYMTILPGSKQPIADQWAINVFMKDLLKTRYGA